MSAVFFGDCDCVKKFKGICNCSTECADIKHGRLRGVMSKLVLYESEIISGTGVEVGCEGVPK